MKLVKHIRIYYPFELEGKKEDFVPTRDMTEAEFKKYKIEPDANYFSIFYTLEDEVAVKYHSAPFCLQSIRFAKDDLAHLSLKTQAQDMLDRLPRVKVGSVSGAKTRYIQAYYDSANEEVSRCKERVVKTLDPRNIKFYADVQRVKLYTESVMDVPVTIDGKSSTIEVVSEPIQPKNYYVGIFEDVGPGGLISFTTEKGNSAFAEKGSSIIPPEQLDSSGKIIFGTSKGKGV